MFFPTKQVDLSNEFTAKYEIYLTFCLNEKRTHLEHSKAGGNWHKTRKSAKANIYLGLPYRRCANDFR